MKHKILIAYFSHDGEAIMNGKIKPLEMGNTRVAAQMLERQTGGDVFRIETVKPYPYSHMETIKIAKKEQQEDARPEIRGRVNDMDAYDTIILGYPKMEYGFNWVLCV